MSATATPEAPPQDLAPAISSNHAADFPVPTGREEQWRFTPLARLAGLHDDSDLTGDAKFVFAAPEPVTVSVLPADDAAVAAVWLPTDRISARVSEAVESAVLVEVPAEAVVADPVVISLTGDGATSAARTLIRLGAYAQAVVVCDHAGTGAHAAIVEADLAEGARLVFVSVQEWDDDAVHAAHQHAKIGRDASFVGINVTLGGDLVRIVSSVDYAAPGGDAELLGVYFADSGQHLEHRQFVDHATAHCRSRVTYKGALQGESARTVWIGDVLIRAAAVGTDTYELNRNLVLTDGARADSVPNLEIETGEIEGAGHASATGRFDDEQLFYLQSRGIPADAARRLVVIGFFAEVLDRIPVPSLRERLLRAVEAELGYRSESTAEVAGDE